jgi:hypothetical protein
MISREDFESFMIRMELDFEEIGENLWIVDPDRSGSASVVVSYSPPLVVMRSAVRGVPVDDEERLALYGRLLERNGSGARRIRGRRRRGRTDRRARS